MSGKMWRLRLVAPKCVEEVQGVAEKVLQGTESVEEKLDSLMERLGIKRVGDDFSKGDVQIRSRRSGRRTQTYAALKRGH